MHLIAHIGTIIVQLGYPGIFLWMAVSACLPIPSEAVLPVAGALSVTSHAFSLPILALVGGVGNLAGSLLAYWIGAVKGRPFLERCGRYVLVHKRDIDSADRWFLRYGEATVLFTRMLPVVRAVISYPAGIAKMPIGRYSAYSFIGGLIWCYILVYAGAGLGRHWDVIGADMRKADIAVGAGLMLLAAVWLWRHLRPDTGTDSVASPNPADAS